MRLSYLCTVPNTWLFPLFLAVGAAEPHILGAAFSGVLILVSGGLVVLRRLTLILSVGAGGGVLSKFGI